MSRQARKRFGQHFLISTDVIDRIVSAIAPRPGQTIVEIGPGHAAITAPLSQYPVELHAIELDRDVAAELSTRFADAGNVKIHQADALQFDFSMLGIELRFAGNLPYNISTPLLFHLLEFSEVTTDMHFMLQKEVVDRMSATPGGKDYGRLTIMLGCRMEIVPLFEVDADAFSPPPRVTSSFVRMRPTSKFDIQDPQVFSRIVRQAFSQRRKTLRNALKNIASEPQIRDAGLEPRMRPEQIPVPGWVRLANRLVATK